LVESLAERVASFRWYHTLELAPGIVTAGMFDHRPAVHRYMLPSDLSGQRCLDVGTMDGFWAFEMERRGADEVVAVDVDDPEALDWPAALRDRTEKSLDRTKGERFELARAALSSRVDRRLVSVYDLSPGMGLFDLVFCGDLLIHLKDPITAMERIRAVCRGAAIICTPVRRYRLGGGRSLAELDGIDEFQWWLLSEKALVRLALAAGFARAELGPRIELPPAGGGRWKGVRGIVRATP
jgi:tRNA (mo5U34)-methyltransferase